MFFFAFPDLTGKDGFRPADISWRCGGEGRISKKQRRRVLSAMESVEFTRIVFNLVEGWPFWGGGTC